MRRKYATKEEAKEALKAQNRNNMKKSRVEIVQRLGGECKICGFLDTRALQIDHVNGDGSAERKEFGFSKGYHKRILISIEAGENKYQLLCANCNWIKRFENKECN